MNNIYHGTAIAILDVDYLNIKKDDCGIITTYLPKDDTFAVFFGNDKWITFKMKEEEFKKIFDIIQEEYGKT
jgi:hypothetical protein